MTRIPRHFINEVLTRTNIVELIHRHVPLKKAGASFTACCPFHSEKTPSFHVSESKQVYHCFGCGNHGNAIGFLMNYERLNFLEAIEDLAHQVGLEVPKESFESHLNTQPLYEILERTAAIYQQALVTSKIAQQYLKSRGLTEVTIKKFHIGFAPEQWEYLRPQLKANAAGLTQLIQTGMVVTNKNGRHYDRFRNRIIFPIRDVRGRVIGFGGRSLGDQLPKYLNSPETELFHKSSELFGLYEAKQAQADLIRVLVVEGYMDVIMLNQYGISEAVATLGTAIGHKHLQRLFRHTQNIVFCFDGDAAGHKASWRALEISLEMMQDGHQIQFMFLPKNEDPDTLIQKEGPEAFKTRMDKAISLADFFFHRITRKVDLNSLEGKAKIATNAKSLLSKIRNGVFQQLMLKRLSEIVGVHSEHLENIEKSPKKSTSSAIALKPVQIAIALLLQYPEIGKNLYLPEQLAETTERGVAVIKKLLDIIQENTHVTTALLLEYWRDSKMIERLTALSIHPLLINPEGAIAELQGVFNKLISLNHEQKIQQLMEKSNHNRLTSEEKNILVMLLKERQTLC